VVKERYTKPLMALELFSLTQTMAGSCTADIPKDQLTANDIHSCAWDFGGVLVYLQEPVCMIPGDSIPLICYNNLGDDAVAFRS